MMIQAILRHQFFLSPLACSVSLAFALIVQVQSGQTQMVVATYTGMDVNAVDLYLSTEQEEERPNSEVDQDMVQDPVNFDSFDFEEPTDERPEQSVEEEEDFNG